MLIDCRDGPQELATDRGRIRKQSGRCGVGLIRRTQQTPHFLGWTPLSFHRGNYPYDLPGPLSWSTSDPTAA